MARLNTTANQGAVYLELLDRVMTDYMDVIAELKSRLPQEIDEMVKSYNLITEELSEYIEQNKMNQWFFM